MHSLNFSFGQNPLAFVLAVLAGTLPAVLWLIFWRREDTGGHRDPTGLLVLVFVAGMLSVVFILPVQKLIARFSTDQKVLITLWAASEEVIKYFAFSAIMARNKFLNKPVEYPIYLMAAGLGFAALENALYLVHPVAVNDATVSFLTGNLRFLGSTLLHSVASGIIGISLGLAFFQKESIRTFNLFFGIAAAIALHAVFNFFIMKDNGENFIQVFGFLWVVTIIIMLLFEKLRRMGSYVERAEKANAY